MKRIAEALILSELSYPRLKVFLAFLFCPLVPGFIAGIIKTIATLAHVAMNPRLIGEVAGAQLLLMPFLAPLLAQAIFLLPFLIFSAVIALMKINRTQRNCTVIALSGACLATLWVVPFIYAVLHDAKGADIAEELIGLATLFATAIASCWLTARLFLPDPADLDILPALEVER
ncbi:MULTISPECIES: hypothetical protein [Pseudomonas]|uniref:hypothetical protein n=1 Tax=Pseudomonas TaxID=286 RepID=UPI00249BBEE3|nr:hypothetical protein [Pseudomonas sp. PS01303]